MAIKYYYNKAQAENVLYLHDFGTAHGREVYGKLDDFIKRIVEILKETKLLENDYYIFGITNVGQTRERGYLKQLGFTTIKVGNLEHHSINSTVFETQIALAVEEAKKEEEALRLAAEKAKKKREERDAREGRKPGEIRVGDIVYYHTHPKETRLSTRYVIVGASEKVVYYASVTDLSYYSFASLKSNGNYTKPTEWERVPAEVEAPILARYPVIEKEREKIYASKKG